MRALRMSLWIILCALVPLAASAEMECGTDQSIRQTPSPADLGMYEAIYAWARERLGLRQRETNEITKRRVNDCASLGAPTLTLAGGRWSLVTQKWNPQSGRMVKVWRDDLTGLLWGERLSRHYTHFEAVALNKEGHVDRELACDSIEAKVANGEIHEKRFGLPLIEEFRQAELNGLSEVSRSLFDHFFWSASLDAENAAYALAYGGYGTTGYGGDRAFPHVSVVCVGRP